MDKLVRFDWAMKKLLRSKANFNILAGFLSELLHEDVTILEILESESNKEHENDKYNCVDMLIRDSTDALIIIEVQTTSEPDYLLRMLYASAKVITEHIDAGAYYHDVKKIISVNIVYFDLGQGDDYLYKGATNFYGVHTGGPLLLTDRQRALYQQASIPDLYPEYYIIKVNQFNDIAKNNLDEWIYFLKNEEIKDSFSAKGLREAKMKFDVMRLPKEERAEYAGFLEAMRTKSSLIKGNFDYGFISGKFEGRADTLLEQLECRFGPLPERVNDIVRALSQERLREITRQIMSAQSLDDLHLE